MAFPIFGVPLLAQTGLTVLLSPGKTSPLFRVGCGLAVAHALYRTFKAIERPLAHGNSRVDLLRFWMCNGLLNLVETAGETSLTTVFPWYYHGKCAILIWLQAKGNRGATKVYDRYLRNFLLAREEDIDVFLKRFHGELNVQSSEVAEEYNDMQRAAREVVDATRDAMRDFLFGRGG